MTPINYLIITHSLENRLYLSPLKPDEIKDDVHDSGRELSGAGVKCYSKLAGIILSIFGLSSRIKVNKNEYIYINNKSFAKFVIRHVDLQKENPSSSKEAAKKLHDLYIKQKESGYDSKKVDLLCKEIKNILKDGIILRPYTMITRMAALV